MDLLGFENYDVLKGALYKWVDREMQTDNSGKENKWTQSIAVRSKTFIKKMKEGLGYRATGWKIICADDTFELREALTPYGKANNPNLRNTFLWDQRPPSLIGQFLHENWPIKTEILVFLGVFSRFFDMLLWPDSRPNQIMYPSVRSIQIIFYWFHGFKCIHNVEKIWPKLIDCRGCRIYKQDVFILSYLTNNISHLKEVMNKFSVDLSKPLVRF